MPGKKRKLEEDSLLGDSVVTPTVTNSIDSIDSKFLKNIYHIYLAGKGSIPYGPLFHPNNPQIYVKPDLIRDDRTVIFMEVSYGDKKLKEIKDDHIQLAYEITGTSDCHLVNIHLTDHGYNQINKSIYPMGIKQSRNYIQNIFCRSIPRCESNVSKPNKIIDEPPAKIQKVDSLILLNPNQAIYTYFTKE